MGDECALSALSREPRRTSAADGQGITGITSARDEGMPVFEQEVPVLVVGGSLVGLTTSVLLASHGVPHMLIERHSGVNGTST